MKTASRNGILAAAATSMLGMAATATADQISVHFFGSPGTSANNVSSTAGVVPQASNWNNDTLTGLSFSSLTTSAGAASTVGYTIGSPLGFNTPTSTAPAWTTNGDVALWTGEIGVSSSTPGVGLNDQTTLTISGISAADQATGYYVYFYLNGNNNQNTNPWYITDGTITDNSNTSGTPNGANTYYFYTSNLGHANTLTSYVNGSSTTAGSAGETNYVEFFETAASDTFTLPSPTEVYGTNIAVGGGGVSMIMTGFQIVQAPEPASAGLFCCIGVAALMRRRRASAAGN